MTFSYIDSEFVKETKFPSGMTAKIYFYPLVSRKGDLAYGIELDNFHKRKENTDLKQTGKDHLKPLIWAKNQINLFEQYLLNPENDLSWPNPPKRLFIFVQGDDNRRRRIYKRYLEKEGYRVGQFKADYWEKSERGLIKQIKINYGGK